MVLFCWRRNRHDALFRYAPRANVVQALVAYTQVASPLEDSRREHEFAPSPLVDLSMTWALQRSFVSGSIVGAHTPMQLAEVMVVTAA